MDITNKDGLTPLTLAARLGFVDVFDAILQRMSGTAWNFGEVSYCNSLNNKYEKPQNSAKRRICVFK